MKKSISIMFVLMLVLLFSTNITCFAASSSHRNVYFFECDTTRSYDFMNAGVSKARWSSPVRNYVYDNGDGTFSVLDATNDPISIKKYSINSFRVKSTKKISYELSKFGGFFSGEKFNYIAFGQTNYDEDNSKVVIKVVKYDKKFNRIKSFKLTNCFTINPFVGGSLRMAECGNKLTVHTSRKRYTTADGYNHQSQLTFTIDTDSMTLLTKNVGPFQENHVGHSFNQFVQYDGSECLYVDHGDAYPRSVVLTKSNSQEIDLFEIPGEIGANCTGVTVGGFEISKNNYLVTINSIDHKKVSSYTSFEMLGLDIDERNAVLLVCNKNTLKTKRINLSWYIGNNRLSSTPYLVKISDTGFAVMWEQYKYEVDNYGYIREIEKGLRYVYVDENGNLLSEVLSVPEMRLSKDCKPEYINGKIVWFADNGRERNIFAIEVAGDNVKIK